MDNAQFDKEDVLSVIRDAGNICSSKVRAYMVGGGAMAIRGEKVATKVVDLILESEDDAQELRDAFIELGFEVNVRHPEECRELVDAEIMTTSRGMRVDIFVKTICHKLVFTEGMKSRSEFYGEMGGIVLFICSKEDIFLLKSVTERNRDLEDMVVLYRKGIDKDILITECKIQDGLDEKIGGRIWEAFLTIKVEEMENMFGITIPWKNELTRIADLKIGVRLVLTQIKAGSDTINGIAARLDIEPSQVRKYVASLERSGLIVLDRKIRPNRINLR